MARYYLITFDLTPSYNRQSDYDGIRAAIKSFVGIRNYFEPLKQCCMVRTRVNAMALRQHVAALVRPGNVLVLRLRHGYATDIIDPVLRKKTRDWLGGVPGV